MNIIRSATSLIFVCLFILLIGLLIKSNFKKKDLTLSNKLNSFADQIYTITKNDYPQTTYTIMPGNDPRYYYVFFNFNERSSKLKAEYILKQCIETVVYEDMYDNFTGFHNVFYTDMIKEENGYTIGGIGTTMFYKPNKMMLNEYEKYIQSYEINNPVTTDTQLVPKKREGFIGYVDESGDFLIYPQYASGNAFSEGIANVTCYNRSSGFIDESGKFIIIFPENSFSLPFSEGLAKLKIRNESGYYDYAFINRNGKIVFECPYFSMDAFHDGFLLVKIGNKWGFLDKQGHIAIEPKFDYAMDFNEGVAKVKKENKWGHIDKFGEIISWE